MKKEENVVKLRDDSVAKAFETQQVDFTIAYTALRENLAALRALEALWDGEDFDIGIRDVWNLISMAKQNAETAISMIEGEAPDT